jgi:hypothetical protein
LQPRRGNDKADAIPHESPGGTVRRKEDDEEEGDGQTVHDEEEADDDDVVQCNCRPCDLWPS